MTFTFTDFPTATVTNLLTCIRSFNISWDASNNLTCGDVFYNVSISLPPVGSEESQVLAIRNITNTFFHFTGLNSSLPDVMVNIAARNRAGQGEVMVYCVQLPKPLGEYYTCIAKYVTVLVN